MRTAAAIALVLLVLLPVLQPAGPICPDASLGAAPLDEEYYNDYLDSLPDERVATKRALEKNLLRVAQTIIPREDFKLGPEFAKTLTESDLKYEKVTRDSPFVRGIMKEMPYLKETQYMWIVKAGRYLIFVTFKADPRRFSVTAHQTRAVIKQEPKPAPQDPARP